jgi:hypothetical protein
VICLTTLGAFAIAAASAPITPALGRSAAMIGTDPEKGLRLRGPYVSAASFSGGQLHETLTFHKAGTFAAYIVSNPRPPSSGSVHHARTVALAEPTVALGYHAAGKTHISFRLGTLTAGRYAVVITPEPLVMGPPQPKLAPTWVYLTVHKNGTITNIKLVHPH